MDQIIIEHKELRKKAVLYFVFALACGGILWANAEQLVLNGATILVILACALELSMGIYTWLQASSREILSPEGVTFTSAGGSRQYPWKAVEVFEIGWEYDKKNPQKDAGEPYILLQFAEMKKPVRFAYTQELDLCIRENYGQPHKDNWTNI